VDIKESPFNPGTILKTSSVFCNLSFALFCLNWCFSTSCANSSSNFVLCLDWLNSRLSCELVNFSFFNVLIFGSVIFCFPGVAGTTAIIS